MGLSVCLKVSVCGGVCILGLGEVCVRGETEIVVLRCVYEEVVMFRRGVETGFEYKQVHNLFNCMYLRCQCTGAIGSLYRLRA